MDITRFLSDSMEIDEITFGRFRLDSRQRELSREGKAVRLHARAMDILCELAAAKGGVVSKDALMSRLWPGRIVEEGNLHVHISALRKALDEHGEGHSYIVTVPGRGYRLVGVAQPSSPAHLPLPDKPSIAVMPFANLSSDPEQEYLVDGIVEDIITELSRFSELFVIARNSSFQYKGKAVDVRQVGRELDVRYLLEGSARKSEDHIRISAQLIDVATGTHRWAEHYDRTLEDVFAVQDDVVRTIVAILAAHVRQAETERLRAKPPNGWQAYDCYLQAVQALAAFSSTLNEAHIEEARRLLQQSLTIDPNYARSYAGLAVTDVSAWHNPAAEDFLNPAVLDRAHDFARKAVQLDRNLPLAHAALGWVLVYKHQHDASIAALEKSVALNPNYVDWRFGVALIRAGDAKRAIEVVHAYMRLDPFYVPFASFVLGYAHLMLKQYPQALSLLRDYVAQAPSARGRVLLAAALAGMGHLEEARAEVAEAVRLKPKYSISSFREFVSFKYPQDDNHFFDGLRKAGLPE